MEIQFTDDAEGRKRFEICSQAVILSNPQLGGRAVQVNEWDDVVALLRALKSVGVKTKQMVGGRELYDLREGGGVMTLSRDEHKLLIDFMKHPMWSPDGIEAVQDTIEWLEELGKAAKKALKLANPKDEPVDA